MSTTQNNLFSEETGHKYTFQLELRKLTVSPSLPFEVKIVWARGQQRIQSQNIIRLQPPETQVSLHQCFCNKSTVLFNSKKQQFRKKQSKIQIILYANGSPKQGGQHLLNLCQILDPYNIKKSQQRIYQVTTRQQKPRCQLQFKLTAEYCQQMIRDEQRSIGSGAASISSKNTMGAMSTDQKNYVEKKNLFLCNFLLTIDQAPSKDNQSVTSYTSYGTGVMRYGSSRKERDDSTSMRKEEYGMPKRQVIGSTGGEFFNKTVNVSSNLNSHLSSNLTSHNSSNLNSNATSTLGTTLTPLTSNIRSTLTTQQQFDIKSRGGYNRYTQPVYDNKTQNFENTSNKQLLQQQTKRSKLQAQVSRLNIYVKQQSTKLTQYITDNTKLKQQINRLSSEQQKSAHDSQTKHQYEELIEKMKRENNDLHNRAFELNNENRELHRKLDGESHERQKLEEEIRRLRMQKQRAENKFDTLNRNMEGIISKKQMSIKQLQNLKDQLEHSKSLNHNLRDSLEKQKRRIDQLQNHNQYQLSTIEDGQKKKQQRLYELERQHSSTIVQLRQRDKQLQAKKQILYRLQRTNEQYKNKILQNQNQKNHLFEENMYLKSEIEKSKRQLSYLNDNINRLKDQKTAQFQQKNAQLESNNYQTLQKVRTLEYQVDQNKKNYINVMVLNQALKKDIDDRKNQIYRLQANIKALKEIQAKYYGVEKMHSQKQRQLSFQRQQKAKLLYRTTQLQQSNRKLIIEIQTTKKKIKQNPYPDVDVNQILRQSVQMQVELKFKTDELIKLKSIQEKYQDVKYKLQIQQRNRCQIESQLDKTQKQLKQKNKLYLIEVEKGKITLRQKNDVEKLCDQVKAELKHCQQIIFNGDKQVKEMQIHIQFLQSENRKLIQKLESLERQLNTANAKMAQTIQFQNTIKQLEKQINQKTYNINIATTNLTNAQRKISQLQYLTRNQQNQLQNAKKTGQSASQKAIQLEQTKTTVALELQKVINQKKSVEIKCEMIMQQLHGLKKQFQQQKGRSTSIVSMRSTEQQVKIRQLQNQMQKKEKTISKLTKQKLQIQQQNINLHVQVMKKLSQMQKGKQTHKAPPI